MMPRKNLPYVNSYRDRTGKMRYYLRRPGCKQVVLPGSPGSREFMQAYACVASTAGTPEKAPVKSRAGQVYYLSDGEHIKIGFTTDWETRKKKYATHAARPPVLLAICPAYRSRETELHQQFKQYRVRRGDWFYPGPELLEHIKRTVDELNAA